MRTSEVSCICRDKIQKSAKVLFFVLGVTKIENLTVKTRMFVQNYIGSVEVQFGAGILPGWVTSGHGLRRDKDLLRLGQQTDALSEEWWGWGMGIGSWFHGLHVVSFCMFMF